MNYEIIGTTASVLVLISFLMKGEKNIRLINIVGAIVFTIYGILSNLFSIWFLNGVLVIIHCYKLYKLSYANKSTYINTNTLKTTKTV